LNVQRRNVVLRMDGDARDAEIAQRAHQPHRDLAAVGHKDLLEQRAAFQGWSFNSRRSTLPAPVVGSASMKRTVRGAL
jgi:hypothetical protein